MSATRRLARLELGDRVAFAELEGGVAHLLGGAPWRGGARTGETVRMPEGSLGGRRAEGVRLLAPVTPSKILCVGRNYRKHAEELQNPLPVEPLLFFKPPSAIIGPGDDVELPPASVSSRVEHEVELGVVIGQRVRRASLEEAARSVLGLTLVADITARDLQKKDGQWTRAKGMDGFCPVGPVIVTGLEPAPLTIVGRVNGVERQRGSTSDMIFPVAEVIAYISQVMTLEPGDLIATGTPEGVGPLVPGDTLEIEIEQIGRLAVGVVAPRYG